MGVIAPVTLYKILEAAATYRDALKATEEINQSIVASGILTPNVRSDSGRTDAWRDYQQILSELALIFSTQVVRRITLTPLGLSFLDGSLSFSEVMSLQALRYQYPNGHKFDVEREVLVPLRGTPLGDAGSLTRLQQLAGVEIRPAVLVWQVLRGLIQADQRGVLSIDEIQVHLMRCSTHVQTNDCVASIVAARGGRSLLLPMARGRRNAQDWIKFLSYTPIFDAVTGRGAEIGLSAYAVAHAVEIDALAADLAHNSSFWKPTTLDSDDRKSWYRFYGSVDVSLSLPTQGLATRPVLEEFAGGEEPEEQQPTPAWNVTLGTMALRPFNPVDIGGYAGATAGRTIDTSYDAGLLIRATRLHDAMVLLIGNTCRAHGARVLYDPATVDLLVQYSGDEYIVEVKSVTPGNFVSRLRYALGQLFQYGFLRSQAIGGSDPKKVIAFAAEVPDSHWCVPFLNDYLDTGLLSLKDAALQVRSNDPLSHRIFAS